MMERLAGIGKMGSNNVRTILEHLADIPKIPEFFIATGNLFTC
jgi:hypothetical protein